MQSCPTHPTPPMAHSPMRTNPVSSHWYKRLKHLRTQQRGIQDEICSLEKNKSKVLQKELSETLKQAKHKRDAANKLLKQATPDTEINALKRTIADLQWKLQAYNKRLTYLQKNAQSNLRQRKQDAHRALEDAKQLESKAARLQQQLKPPPSDEVCNVCSL